MFEPRPSKEVRELAKRAARMYLQDASEWGARPSICQSNALQSHEATVLDEAGLGISDAVASGDADPAAEAVVDYMNMLSSSLTVRQAADHLGISTIDARRRIQRRCLAAISENRRYIVPRFQFDRFGLVPSFSDIFSVTALDTPLIVFFRWFIQPSPDLPAKEKGQNRNLSPREWLLAEFDAGPIKRMAATL